ncbi:MAG TPA: hypothetical protein PLN52_18750 [Opitutaceae bacterium]|nr:hypothetical protein [Opitutaceae bacterium]
MSFQFYCISAAIACWLASGWLTPAWGQKRGETWTRVTTPHVTLLSSAPAKRTQEWAVQFEQFCDVMGTFFPSIDQPRQPLTLVIFRDRRSFEPFLPKEGKKAQNLGGYFSQGIDRAHIAMSEDAWAGDNSVITTLFHETVHWYTSGMSIELPAWLSEGVAELFSTFKVQADQFILGEPLVWHLRLLATHRWIPLRTLSATHRGALTYNDDVRTGVFYAESWAFVHYLMFGEGGGGIAALNEYLNSLKKGVHPDDAFQKAFGGTYEDLDTRLKTYLKTGKYRKQVGNFERKGMENSFEHEAATIAEVETAKGSLLMKLDRKEEAAARFELALAQGKPSIDLLEARGHLAVAKKDFAAAAKEFSGALEQGSRSFFAHYLVGFEKLNPYLDGDSKFNSVPKEVVTSAANDFKRAINLHPRFQPAYHSLAGIMGIKEAQESDREFMTQGEKFFPQDAMIQLGLATLDYREKAVGPARERLARVLEWEPRPDQTTMGYARRLSEAWERDDFESRLTQLMEKRSFDEALALIDSALPKISSVMERLELGRRREIILVQTQLEEVQDMLEDGRWVEAKPILEKMLASEVNPAAKRQAAQWLDSIRRMQERAERRASERR